MAMTRCSRVLAVWCLVCALPAAADMTITWVNLNPEKASSSVAYGVEGTNQVGYAVFGGEAHAVMWSGAADMFTDLNPVGALNSTAFALSGTNQAGYATFGNAQNGYFDHAALWSGTRDSFVDLNPAGALYSRAQAVSGTQQAGYARFLIYYPPLGDYFVFSHAALWSGTAPSFVDLHPPQYYGSLFNSYAFGLNGEQQAGRIQNGTAFFNAALWKGTASSFLNLDPASDYGEGSGATSMGGNRVAGYSWITSVNEPHAVQWAGKADPYVDLHPPGHFHGAFYYSTALATTGREQAGVVAPYQGHPSPHAALWFGTGSSFVDLHTVLGPNYTNSEAHGIWTRGNNGILGSSSTTYVVGFATETQSGTKDAILWTIQRNTTWPAPFIGNPTTALRGLNLFSSLNNGDPSQGGKIKLLNTGSNGWFGAVNPVTYSLTITNYPGTNYPDYQTHIFLINGLPPTNETAPDFNATNLIFLDIRNHADGTASAALRYKINLPDSNDVYGTNNGTSGTLAEITAPSILGFWRMTFFHNTNVTLAGPGPTISNFTISASTAAQFAEPLTVYLGSRPNSTPNIGQAVVLSRFSVSGSAAPVTDNFIQDSSFNTSIWQTVAADPATVQIVPAGSGCWLNWSLPDSGFFLETTADLVSTNSWTALTGPDAAAGPFASLSTGDYRLLLLSSSNLTATAGFFRLKQQPFTKLQVLMPGESAAPGTASGKTGTPNTQTVGIPFPVTVKAVDDDWNVMTLVTDTVNLSSTDLSAAMAAGLSLVNGTGIFNVNFGTDGVFTVTAADDSDSTKAADTSSPTTVAP